MWCVQLLIRLTPLGRVLAHVPPGERFDSLGDISSHERSGARSDEAPGSPSGCRMIGYSCKVHVWATALRTEHREGLLV